MQVLILRRTAEFILYVFDLLLQKVLTLLHVQIFPGLTLDFGPKFRILDFLVQQLEQVDRTQIQCPLSQQLHLADNREWEIGAYKIYQKHIVAHVFHREHGFLRHLVTHLNVLHRTFATSFRQDFELFVILRRERVF